MLDAAVASAGLAGEFERVLSVDPLRAYKPDPRVYQLAVEALGVERDSVMFVSGNLFDVAGAGRFGFTTAWINRSGAAFEELGVSPDHTLVSLEDLAPILADG